MAAPKAVTRARRTARRDWEEETHTIWVPISEMRFDPRVNRKLRQSRVDSIAANFDPEKVGIIHLSHRGDGSYIVIEGQHRVRALVQLGWTDQRMESKVYEGLTVAEEAERMLALNDKLTVSRIDEFLIAVVASDPEAVAINNIVRDAGLVIDGQSRDGVINCVAALEKVYRGESQSADAAHPKVLGQVLDVVTSAWGRTKAAGQGDIIQGVGLVLHRYGDQVELDRLITKLAPVPGGPAGLIGRARAAREYRGGSVARNVAAIVVEVYNKGRRQGALSDWWVG